jgi:hypothetical protein
MATAAKRKTNPKKRSPIDEGLDDIRNGRVYTVSNPENVIEECLRWKSRKQDISPLQKIPSMNK